MRIYPFFDTEIKAMRSREEISEWEKLMRENVGLSVEGVSGELSRSVSICKHGPCDCDEDFVKK